MKNKVLLFTLAAFAMAGCATGPAADQPTVLDPVVVAPSPASKTVQAKITSIATGSPACSTYSWKERGKAPIGYMKGMALVYANQYCNQFRGDVAVVRKSAGVSGGDVLSHYADVMKSKGLSGAPALRQVYTILIGLGMRESSGKYCCGRDMSANFSTASSAESGVMQTSWDVSAAHSELPKIFARYKSQSQGCFLDVFKEGVSSSYCAGTNAKNWGDPSSTGYQFQARQKTCPGLAVEYAALTTRVSGGIKGHYGPLRNKASEVLPACASMLASVEKFIDDNPTACNSL